MCGIAGFFNPSGITPDTNILGAMALAIAHRGPDHQGLHQDERCALASRRLAIIDLQGGNQPLVHEPSGMILVFNGEIYNYQPLRVELASLGHHFRTRSDSEVLLAAYVQWGEKCLDRLAGMFAFAIWNPGARRLFLARDRMGKKPLFYAALPDGTLVFASEIKAILHYPGVPRAVNALAMDRLLDYGFNLAPDTFLEGIRQVPPASFLVHDGKGLRVAAYWDIPMDAPPAGLSEDDATEGLRHHLMEAVRARLVSDVPVASYLSGGIDSSSVTGLYAHLSNAPVHTLSITFEDAGYDERHFARMVSGAFGTTHHEFLCSIEEKEIENLVWHLETPLVTLLNLPLYLLSRQIRDMGFKVVLSGDGADEILGGYDYFKLLKLMDFIGRSETPARANLLRRVFPALSSPQQALMHYTALKGFPAAHPALPYRFQAFQMKGQLLSDGFIERLLPRLGERDGELPTVPGSRSLLDQALYLESRMRLPNLTLPLADTMSMANSVELRSPFMDHRLVEYVFSLPGRFKMRGLNEKHLLKKGFRTFLPPAICRRRKQPLAPPGKWFVRMFRGLIGESLSPIAVRDKGYFRPEFIEHMLREFDSDSTMDYSGVLIVAFFVHLFDDLFLCPKTRRGC
ncbi:asparagine synthase (glutamine-hydrolyzing) [Desulfomicrobium salsuginis]